MTPKEHAKLIYTQFDDDFALMITVHKKTTGEEIDEYVKQCAVRAVEGILEVLGGVGVWGSADFKVEKYWEEVLEEIHNI